MRVIIVLCLVAIAVADHLGYNYHPVDQSYTPGADVSADTDLSYNGDNGSVGAASNAAPSFGTDAAGAASNDEESSYANADFGALLSDVASGPSVENTSEVLPVGSTHIGQGFESTESNLGVPSNDVAEIAPQVELQKEFYTFTANEEDFNEPDVSNQIASSVKQGLRIVFIKSPENSGFEDAAIALARQAAEKHTSIYILNKQSDLADLANKLNSANSNANNKPEVHFVKYRTAEDAANAQKAIQVEYDTLSGPSQHIDGGVAPALNFASHAPVAQQAAASQQVFFAPVGQQVDATQTVSVGPQATFAQQVSLDVDSQATGIEGSDVNTSYLPAAIFRRLRF